MFHLKMEARQRAFAERLTGTRRSGSVLAPHGQAAGRDTRQETAGAIGGKAASRPDDARQHAQPRAARSRRHLQGLRPPHHGERRCLPRRYACSGARAADAVPKCGQRGASVRLDWTQIRQPWTPRHDSIGSSDLTGLDATAPNRKTTNHRLDSTDMSVLATRKPMKFPTTSSQSRLAARRALGSLNQQPPRTTWPRSLQPVVHAEPSFGAPL